MTTATETPAESLTDAIRTSLSKLAVLRASVQQRIERIGAARANFEATIADELAKLEAEKRAIEAEDSAIRGMALVQHETTGTTKITDGVEVVIGKEYTIDEAAGFTWAKEKGMCLVPEALDLKAVKKLATVQALPFVTIATRPSVRIASDLSKLLPAPTTGALDTPF